MDASLQTKQATSADGSANQADSAKRLTQYFDRVTGTDIVSDTEFDAGFTITGKAAAGQAANIKFYLDNDRTDGADQRGAQLVHGQGGVSINYNATTGDFAITFGPDSSVLKQAAVHNTAGAGVHKISVDSNGDNTLDASRLFLVADGTAGASSTDKAGSAVDNDTVAANFTVQDVATKQVFVYFHGDVDGNGTGLWTLADPAGNDTSRDNGGYHGPHDWDYYNSGTPPTGTETTALNTALGYVTNFSAKTYEFSIGLSSRYPGEYDWSTANNNAADHLAFNSNTSRLASYEELLAVYAANFSSEATVDYIEPVNEWTMYDVEYYVDNRPGGWSGDFCSSSPTPSGHAYLDLIDGTGYDYPDGDALALVAVL